jgi:hypothetical protein
MPIGEGKPWISQSAGCHPSQSKEFNEQLKQHGIKCAEYLPDGTLKCTSRKARNEVLKSRELFDKDAGYGDYAGK